jgi:plasmid stability protein
MSTLVVRNLPEPLQAQLKARALANHRSVNKEVVALIEQALQAPARSPVELPPPIKLRGGRMLSIEEIEAAIADGQK